MSRHRKYKTKAIPSKISEKGGYSARSSDD